MNDQNIKNLCYLFDKTLKMRQKYYEIIKLFYTVKREDAQS